MQLGYIEYLIVPDQIQSDCKARAEVPTAQSTNSTEPPCFICMDGSRFSFLLSQGLGLVPAASSVLPASQTQLGSFSTSFLDLFLVSKGKGQSSPRSILEGWCALREWQGAPHSSFCSQHPRKIRQGRHTGREKVSKGYFYAFLAVAAVSDQCGGSVHHQQQPFFFWGAFGTSSALFFNSFSRTLSNLGEKEAN